MGPKKAEKALSQTKSIGLKENEGKPTISPEDEWWYNPEKYIRDGRIFEADREMVFSEDEEAEMKEFKELLKQYHVNSRKLLRNAIATEQEELRNGKISGYFEGTVKDRLDALRAGQRLLESAESIASYREDNKSRRFF